MSCTTTRRTRKPTGCLWEDFKLLYLYKVDLTDAACEAYLGNAGPSVQIMDVERKISNPTAHQISINVDKSVYTRFIMAMSAYSGSWLKNEYPSVMWHIAAMIESRQTG